MLGSSISRLALTFLLILVKKKENVFADHVGSVYCVGYSPPVAPSCQEAQDTLGRRQPSSFSSGHHGRRVPTSQPNPKRKNSPARHVGKAPTNSVTVSVSQSRHRQIRFGLRSATCTATPCCRARPAAVREHGRAWASEEERQRRPAGRQEPRRPVPTTPRGGSPMHHPSSDNKAPVRRQASPHTPTPPRAGAQSPHVAVPLAAFPRGCAAAARSGPGVRGDRQGRGQSGRQANPCRAAKAGGCCLLVPECLPGGKKR
jgi:hypothetical protein